MELWNLCANGLGEKVIYIFPSDTILQVSNRLTRYFKLINLLFGLFCINVYQFNYSAFPKLEDIDGFRMLQEQLQFPETV